MDPDTGNREDFAGAMRMLRRQRWVVVATAAVIGLAALASALLATPAYRSSVEVVVEPVRFGFESAFASSTLVQQELATQRRIAVSQQVAAMVAAELGGELDAQELLGRVTAEQLEETRIIRIVARDGDADRAAAIAGGFADAYLASRRQEVDERLEDATADLRARADEVRARIVTVQQELQGGAGGAQRPALAQERDSLLAQLGDITTQLTSLEASGAIARSGGEVIRQAGPGTPMTPDPVQRTVLGLFVGLLLGLAIGWVREHRTELFAG